MRPIYNEKMYLVLKQLVMISVVVLISSGLHCSSIVRIIAQVYFSHYIADMELDVETISQIETFVGQSAALQR